MLKQNLMKQILEFVVCLVVSTLIVFASLVDVALLKQCAKYGADQVVYTDYTLINCHFDGGGNSN